MQKDYYKTLGVIQDAEDIVIKAAYRALAQRYHPDKWTGDPAEATRRMSAINVAYKILSDPAKRKQYDQSRASNEYDESGEDSSDAETEDSFGNSLDDDWKEAVKYFPDLDDILRNLSKISKLLAQTYKVYLLENKEFSKRKTIAAQFEMRFLEKYFGVNEEIIKFARFLINLRARAAAKDLNRAVTLLGKDVDSQLIINRILQDYPDASAAYQSPPQKPDNPSDFHTGTNRAASRTNAAILAFISGVVIFILVIAISQLKPEENKYVKPEYAQLANDDGLAAYNRGDYAQAIRIWEPLAAHGDARAQITLGKEYLEGYSVPQDRQVALKWFRLAAAQGDAKAQENLKRPEMLNAAKSR